VDPIILHCNAQTVEVSHTAKGAAYKVIAEHHDHLSPLELAGVCQVLDAEGYRLTISIMALKEKRKKTVGDALLGQQVCTEDSCKMYAEAIQRHGNLEET
jgi:hypothetical protein